MTELRERWEKLVIELDQRGAEIFQDRRIPESHIRAQAMALTVRHFLQEFLLIPYVPFLIERFSEKRYDDDLPVFLNGQRLEYNTIVLPDGSYKLGYLDCDWYLTVENGVVVRWGEYESVF